MGAGATFLAFCLVFAPETSQAEAVVLGSDQRAIIDKIDKSTHTDNVEYAIAPTDPVGAEVILPFRGGQTITLVRTGSLVRQDGSVSWIGVVKDTGERAALMLWGNALLTGYFAYKGTIFGVENLGGGLHAFAELGRDKQLPDHPEPSPGVTRDSAPDVFEDP